MKHSHKSIVSSYRFWLPIAFLFCGLGWALQPDWSAYSALGQAGTIPLPPPAVLTVSPAAGNSDIPLELWVSGDDFVAGAALSLVAEDTEILLQTDYLATDYLRGLAPSGLESGSYDVKVTNPDGQWGVLPAAYTVLDAASDDLAGYSHELWNAPTAWRVNQETHLGLVVHRVGGKAPLANIVTRFYLGDPATGGAVLGEGAVPMLAPGGVASTASFIWRPSTAGEYILYAWIDPDDQLGEVVRTNNVVSRTVTVLQAAPDLTPPAITQFTLNDGAQDTYTQTIQINVEASDPAGGSGVRSWFVREYFFSQSAERWAPVQESGWVPAGASVRRNYAWTLAPITGVRVLLAWAADAAGNISATAQTFINYVRLPDQLEQEQVRLYRYWLKVGERLAVQVTPAAGDPDLYVWAPIGATPRQWVSNQSGSAAELISLSAPVGGVYQVEVYAYAATAYTLTATLQPPATRTSSPTAWVLSSDAPPNPERQDPLVELALDPGVQQSVPSAPSDPAALMRWLRLPLVQRH